MSIEQDCPSCVRGEHERHNRDHGIRPGLIGGTYCGCSGDCAERFVEAGRRFMDWVRGTANFDPPKWKCPPHTHVTGDPGDGLCHDCGVGGL